MQSAFGDKLVKSLMVGDRRPTCNRTLMDSRLTGFTVESFHVAFECGVTLHGSLLYKICGQILLADTYVFVQSLLVQIRLLVHGRIAAVA